jgi:Flp pilus assembly pilin Flp
MKGLFVRFVREDEGQDLIEYALLATFIAIVAAVGAGLTGTSLNTWYTDLSTYIDTMAAKIPGA